MPTLRIGHKGAAHIAPGNTLASFDAALHHRVDMIEFDVLPERADGSGELFLAHDYGDLERRRDTALTLTDCLTYFASERYGAMRFDVDLKLAGYEQRAVAALRNHGLAERSIISTMETVSLRLLRAAAPDIKLGWSLPKVRRDYLRNPLTRPIALLALRRARRVLPPRVAREIGARRIDAVMAHWALVSPELWRQIAAAGGELYVWTVDDAARIADLIELGVTGVITNDPRLFADGTGAHAVNGSRTSPR